MAIRGFYEDFDAAVADHDGEFGPFGSGWTFEISGSHDNGNEYQFYAFVEDGRAPTSLVEVVFG